MAAEDLVLSELMIDRWTWVDPAAEPRRTSSNQEQR
jgi:hypothetical protein